MLDNFVLEPSMAQTYFVYLSKMLNNGYFTQTSVEKILKDKRMLFDYQRQWIYSILLFSKKISESILNLAIADLQNSSVSNYVRGVCAILIGKYGSASQRRILKTHYSSENSEYVRGAILFAAQYFPSSERDTCFKAWSTHNETNSLIFTAIKNKGYS